MARQGILLHSGRTIRLTSMLRQGTYAGLLGGVPTALMNDQILECLVEKGRSLEGAGYIPPRAFLVLPYKVNPYPRADWVWFRRTTRYTRGIRLTPELREALTVREVMPPIASIGVFSSEPTFGGELWAHQSSLAVVWLQDESLTVLEERPLRLLKRVDWDRHAFDWEY